MIMQFMVELDLYVGLAVILLQSVQISSLLGNALWRHELFQTCGDRISAWKKLIWCYYVSHCLRELDFGHAVIFRHVEVVEKFTETKVS